MPVDENDAYNVFFGLFDLYPQSSSMRDVGLSVRLVREVK
jgi:hypothetical protein